MVLLPKTDEEFETWRDQHPGGYIINAHKQHGLPMYWHQAGACWHISGHDNWVNGDYLKACSLNAGELAVWAKARREELRYCQDCAARWEKEQSA